MLSDDALILVLGLLLIASIYAHIERERHLGHDRNRWRRAASLLAEYLEDEGATVMVDHAGLVSVAWDGEGDE